MVHTFLHLPDVDGRCTSRCGAREAMTVGCKPTSLTLRCGAAVSLTGDARLEFLRNSDGRCASRISSALRLKCVSIERAGQYKVINLQPFHGSLSNQ